MDFDLLNRRRDKFMLWAPAQTQANPQLVIGTIVVSENPDVPSTVNEFFTGPFVKSDQPDLWELDPKSIQPALKDGTMYHYWFEIHDTSPTNYGAYQVTDPIAYTVDYRTTKSRDDNVQPASVIKFRDGKLWPCDIDGNEPGQVTIPTQDNIPDNNHAVIYELPVSWARYKTESDGVETDVGTFVDVLALFDQKVAGKRFKALKEVTGEAIVADLGINVLELLPAADAKSLDAWGYATADYFAPDYDLGTSSELVKLVNYIHGKGIRLFTDTVMAFGHDPYIYIGWEQFHIDPPSEPDNPDSYASNNEGMRDGFGGRPWRYIRNTNTYNPQTGVPEDNLHPSWLFHRAHLHRWMTDFGVGGLRLDSINNIANYDFIKFYKDYAWQLYQARYPSASSAKFLVIGEELQDPISLISSGTLNALWNEGWQRRIRALILGNGSDGDDFEWTVRKMANCTLDRAHPFYDGSQAVNYITSHDTDGGNKQRLYNYLNDNGVYDVERRAKLAFACFLTAVGIPMIFAGEEFCDQMDVPLSQKQDDPVNYERKSEDWRTRVFNYVATLVNLRKKCPALGVDDTNFIHVDNSRGGKIMAWTRGGQGQAPVVVVVNFTDEDTPGTEYVVENWPESERTDWMEITQNRAVPEGWVGREPLMSWEAKVYTYWKES
jgi:1,4-alpha-glucan branching enzyme